MEAISKFTNDKTVIRNSYQEFTKESRLNHYTRANSILVNHDERASSMNKKRAEVVLLEFSKAPDPICHGVIIGKLVRGGLGKRTTK